MVAMMSATECNLISFYLHNVLVGTIKSNGIDYIYVDGQLEHHNHYIIISLLILNVRLWL